MNQVATQNQIDRLAKADILGFCFGDNYFSMEDFKKLKMGKQKVSFAVTPHGSATLLDLAAYVADGEADYFEFTPSEPEKIAELNEELKVLSEVDRPKIANGFFVLADDDSFLRMEDYFDILSGHGVEFFQFEIVSVLDEHSMLPKNFMSRAEKLFSSHRVLVSDSFSSMSEYPIKNIDGFYFNLERDSQENYDLSEQKFSLSKVLRVIGSA
ncbi:hypothetical protein [Williamsia sp. CHRR-6]|uniref:hypothetical protein n=1 Tax=Williamsia sp. CHRR-6 TaxID=2835871 RepID=UPI001BD9C94B|nr:hypothetical protein [Williamsia sp. CHRR-6]MBT0567095.1 hypothetical protein [Williamsia sp. CHRR-6]